MNCQISRKEIAYNGSQLKSGWIKETFGITGDAAVAFIGACNVSPEFMVDLEDLAAGASIYSRKMLHFIIEHPSCPLSEMVARQRLFISIIKDLLEESSSGLKLARFGDDLFDGPFKLTVSIATKGPASSLIHTGINVESTGTPVPTKGLKDYGIKPKLFASKVLRSYLNEIESIRRAIKKVRPVK